MTSCVTVRPLLSSKDNVFPSTSIIQWQCMTTSMIKWQHLYAHFNYQMKCMASYTNQMTMHDLPHQWSNDNMYTPTSIMKWQCVYSVSIRYSSPVWLFLICRIDQNRQPDHIHLVFCKGVKEDVPFQVVVCHPLIFPLIRFETAWWFPCRFTFTSRNRIERGSIGKS